MTYWDNNIFHALEVPIISVNVQYVWSVMKSREKDSTPPCITLLPLMKSTVKCNDNVITFTVFNWSTAPPFNLCLFKRSLTEVISEGGRVCFETNVNEWWSWMKIGVELHLEYVVVRRWKVGSWEMKWTKQTREETFLRDLTAEFIFIPLPWMWGSL